MIPHIIHFSVPRHINPSQQAAIDLAQQQNPGWEIKVWQDPINPSGFRLAKYWANVNSGAQLADLIRLEVVFRHGGIYLDSDIRVVRSLDGLARHCDFFVCSENGNVATNAAFGAVAGHPALDRLICELLESPPDWSLGPEITTGPGLFTRVLKWRKDITILPRVTFYPYYVHELPKPPGPATYGVHLWAGSWHEQHPPASGFRRALSDAGLRRPLREAKRRFNAARFFLGQRLEACRIMALGARHRFLSPKLRGYSATAELIRKTVHGPTILLSGHDVSITPQVYLNGYYELREELFLKRVLKGGDFFLDVGANVGTFSLLAAQCVGPFGRVFSYEPNPTVANLLRKSAAMNWMHERIVVRPVAVGAKKSTAKLEVASSLLGGVGLKGNKDLHGTSDQTRRYLGEVSEIQVDVVRLDDEFPYDIPIRVLKIDAEGLETEVLAGAQRLFSSNCVDYAILEAIPEVAGNSWHSLMASFRQIVSFGYTPYVFKRAGTAKSTTVGNIAQGWCSRNVIFKRNGA
jgi:FkbM family methyltransferase